VGACRRREVGEGDREDQVARTLTPRLPFQGLRNDLRPGLFVGPPQDRPSSVP
jgi:hypothetical protein